MGETTASAGNAIEVRGISKSFRIPHERQTTLLERVLTTFRPPSVDVLQALDAVSLDVPVGSFVGIIGANGSGKSTLLKIMAELLMPDAGTLTVHGRLVPLLELGLGFHQELSLRENVALYGSVLGYPRDQISRRVAEVIAFAELEEFRDAKLKSLSSGMLVRLAFSTALRADADILLLDEIMAVGDARFQRKCIEVFMELQRQRRTIVLVSHDLSSVQRFCERVYWLDHGRLVMAGSPAEVVQSYLSVMQTAALPPAGLDAIGQAQNRFGDGRVRFRSVRLLTEGGDAATFVTAGSRPVLAVTLDAHASCEQVVFGFVIWLAGRCVYSTNTALTASSFGKTEPGEHWRLDVPFWAALANGHYSLSVAAVSGDGTIHDWIDHAVSFAIAGSRCGDGIADLGAVFHCTPDVPDLGDDLVVEPPTLRESKP